MNFLHGILKNNQISNFIKILPVGAEIFRANRWTYRETSQS